MNKLRHVRHSSRFFVAGLASLVLVTGCGPAIQQAALSTTAPATTVPGTASAVPAGTAWTDIQNGIELGSQAAMYKVMMTVNVAQGSMHSTYSVYGTINAPDKASLSFHQRGLSTAFYQQGAVAYLQEAGRWSSTPAYQNLDVYTSYRDLVLAAKKANISVVQLPDSFVVDEYCSVYQAEIPNSFVKLPGWWKSRIPGSPGDTPVQYTFYVGKTDHVLRQVTTSSAGGVSNIGSLEVQSTTEWFDVGNAQVAEVKIPPDLFQQLLGLSYHS